MPPDCWARANVAATLTKPPNSKVTVPDTEKFTVLVILRLKGEPIAVRVAALLQLSFVSPSGAWLMDTVPFVTARSSGPNSMLNAKAVASIPTQVWPVALVRRSICKVPEPLTPPDGMPALI